MMKKADGFGQCFNCGKPVPKGAKRCLHCEADLTDMADLTAEDMDAATEALEQAMPGGLEALRAMAEGFDTAEDFANAIFVGACPACDFTVVGNPLAHGVVIASQKLINDATVKRKRRAGFTVKR
jgi:hypothetical protein